MCKLDLEKAYDHVNWDFLMYMLQRCGFGVKWRLWIWRCISLTSYSILLNGIPKGYFGCSRGIRQGDLISLLLFLLVGVLGGGMLERAVAVGMFEGFSTRNGGLMVSHLQFADDTIIFCDNSQRQIRLLRCVLHCFKVVSGLKLNLGKSNLFSIGEVPNLDQLAADLECKQGSFPSSYLGLPLGVKYKQKEVWYPLVERKKKRLSG